MLSLWPLITQTPTILIAENTELPDKVFIEETALLGLGGHYLPSQTLGILTDENDISDLLLTKEAERIIKCESNNRHEGVWGKAGEYGKWQFLESSFYWLANLANYKNVDWKNEHDQDLVGEWSLKNGYGYLWSCY